MKRLLLLLFLLLPIAAQTGLGQSTKGAITGHVADTTGAIIQNAVVQLAPSGFSTTSDSTGNFTFPAVPPGAYILQVNCQGFTASTKDVTITAGQTLHMDLSLAVAAGNEQVMVSALTGKDMIQAVNEEITSPNILQVMPESEILALPNANVADAVGRLPGVTVQREYYHPTYAGGIRWTPKFKK